VDKIKRPENHALPMLDLALGDPSVFGNLPPAPEVLAAVTEAVADPNLHGYTNSCGTPGVRAAVAAHQSTPLTPYTADDIIITSGASQALLLAAQLYCNPGDRFLTPAPAFALYETIAGHLGITPVRYPLLPAQDWEIDLPAMEARITEAAAAGSPVKFLLLNNPGNPTGSNWAPAHVAAIAALAAKHKIPVVSDEIYGNMVFSGQTFTPFADVAGDVPVITVGGTAKQFLTPGWRVGWLAICDRAGLLASLRGPLVSLTQVVLGASTIMQGATEKFLKTVPTDYYTKLNATLEEHAKIVVAACTGIPGLEITPPQGAMYAMVRIKHEEFADIADDAAFTQLLLNEQNVMVLPGSCFKAPGFFRIVFCAPPAKLEELAGRLRDFSAAHIKK